MTRHRGGGWKGGHGSTQEVGSAKAYVPLVTGGEFAYKSKELPVIAFFASMLAVYTLQTEIVHLRPKIDQRKIVIAGGEVSV